MDFLYMNFSILFEKKHGKKIFNKICMLINKENPTDYNNSYVSTIFKIAFLDFFGLREYKIQELIEDLLYEKTIDVKSAKYIHNQSISQIKKYLKSFM